MPKHNGLYLFIPASDKKNTRFVRYCGGDDSAQWLDFCYDLVAPASRLIDIVSVSNYRVPLAFSGVDIVLDDEGLFSNGDCPEVNSFASFLYGSLLVGDVLLGYCAYDAKSEGNHVFPLSEHPHFAFLHDTIASFLSLDVIPEE